MTIRTEDVTIGTLAGYLATPSNPRAAMLLLPTVAGVDAFSRNRADVLAQAGFTTLAWHPYSGQASTTDLQDALKRSQTLTDRQSLDEMSQWLRYLRDYTGATSIGVIGFCMGGRFALLLCAQETRLKACATVYPSLYEPRLPNQEEDAVARAAEIGCPVALTYPGRDHVTSSETLGRLQANLWKRDAPTTVHHFPAARHGFLHHHGDANVAAARHAWPQIVGFLNGALTAPAT
jgi:carboxymethylenebutenolidase